MNKVQKGFISRALDDAEELSEWEYDFINSLAARDDDYTLSEAQNKVLNRIAGKLQL